MIFGRAPGFGFIDLDLFAGDGTDGFTIQEDAGNGQLGRNVSGAGDINDD